MDCSFIAEGWGLWMFDINGITHTRNVYSDGNEWVLDRLIHIYGEEHTDAIINGQGICPVCHSIHVERYDEDTYNITNGGVKGMKKKKWLLEAQLISGKGVNQVKVGELMGDFKEENVDEFREAVSTLIEAGETREYNEGVFLRLGEYEGATIEEAYNSYFEAFDGDDHNELFFMNQIEAIELAGCACGGKCGTGDNTDKLAESKALLDSVYDTGILLTADDSVIEEIVNGGDIYVQEKIAMWKESRYKFNEGATVDSVKADLTSGEWASKWERKDWSMVEETEEGVVGAGTFELYDRHNKKIGGN